MDGIWQIFLMLVTLSENVFAATENFAMDYRFTKSLLYSDEKNYLWEPYRETLKSSRESLEMIDDTETKQLEKIIGSNNAELMRQGLDRRRSTLRSRSPAGRRRTRSQALRREKLNIQSLRSHLSHTKHLNVD